MHLRFIETFLANCVQYIKIVNVLENSFPVLMENVIVCKKNLQFWPIAQLIAGRPVEKRYFDLILYLIFYLKTIHFLDQRNCWILPFRIHCKVSDYNLIFGIV